MIFSGEIFEEKPKTEGVVKIKKLRENCNKINKNDKKKREEDRKRWAL